MFWLRVISHHVTLVLRQSHTTLRHSSITEDLTGLNNRRFLFERFKHIDQQSRNQKFAVMVVDVDHFKGINDTYGHACGDAVLMRVADKLIECFPPQTDVCRIGGEEFCVIVEHSHIRTPMLAAELARKTIDHLSIYTHRQNIHCTVSIGVALGNHEQSMSNTMSQADQALYFAKQSGRNKVVCFQQEQHEQRLSA